MKLRKGQRRAASGVALWARPSIKLGFCTTRVDRRCRFERTPGGDTRFATRRSASLLSEWAPTQGFLNCPAASLVCFSSLPLTVYRLGRVAVGGVALGGQVPL
jgi:hypothetical protein